MKLHFMKERGSRSDLQEAISRWENKLMDTESNKVSWKVDHKGRVLCINMSFLEMLSCL